MRGPDVLSQEGVGEKARRAGRRKTYFSFEKAIDAVPMNPTTIKTMPAST